MKNVIVTGATSFIGAPLVDKLSKSDCFVFAVVRPNSPNISKLNINQNVRIIECDLKSIGDLNRLINVKCDCFFHIAWSGTRAPERDNFDIQNQNYINCLDAYEVSKIIGCKTFISIGSQAEYGKCDGIVSENHALSPVTEYGKAKMKSYLEIKKRSLIDKVKFGWIRLFSAYGPGDYKNSLVSMCIEKMRQNKDIELTTGDQSWNYIYIDDVINILYNMMKTNNYSCESFNVCSNDSRPLKEYILELKDILNSKSKLLFGSKEYSKSEGVVSFIPKNDKIKTLLHYTDFISFKEGIMRMNKIK